MREHPDGYFRAAFSSCRKADLHQLGEQVGIPRGLSTWLGPCSPGRQGGEEGLGAQGVYRSQFTVVMAGEMQKRGRHMVGSSLGKVSEEGALGTRGSCLCLGRACEEWR